MTADSMTQTSQVINSINYNRKRSHSGEACADDGPAQVPTADRAKRQKTAVPNHGWGELFKNRQTFVQMHIC